MVGDGALAEIRSVAGLRDASDAGWCRDRGPGSGLRVCFRPSGPRRSTSLTRHRSSHRQRCSLRSESEVSSSRRSSTSWARRSASDFGGGSRTGLRGEVFDRVRDRGNPPALWIDPGRLHARGCLGRRRGGGALRLADATSPEWTIAARNRRSSRDHHFVHGPRASSVVGGDGPSHHPPGLGPSPAGEWCGERLS